MNKAEITFPSDNVAAQGDSIRLLDRLGRRAVLATLAGIEEGHLTLLDGGQTMDFGGDSDLDVTITVTDSRFYGIVAFGVAVKLATGFGLTTTVFSARDWPQFGVVSNSATVYVPAAWYAWVGFGSPLEVWSPKSHR